MSLRTEASAAYAASLTARDNEARAALGAILTPSVVSALTIAETIVEPSFTMIIFTDGDLAFALRAQAVFDEEGNRLPDAPWTVTLVRKVAGDTAWTMIAEITTLAQLGKSLPLSPPPAWAVGVSYVIGSMVTFGGFMWTCKFAHISTAVLEPPTATSRWTKGAAV